MKDDFSLSAAALRRAEKAAARFDPAGVRAHMVKHREILAPKFAAVIDALESELGGLGVAEWTNPSGGYFISLDVNDGIATRVVQLAKEAGIALTPAIVRGSIPFTTRPVIRPPPIPSASR